MHRPGEHINRHSFLHLITACLKYGKISCQTCWLAGNVDHAVHAEINDPFERLRVNAIARRIQYDEIRLRGGSLSADRIKADYDMIKNRDFLIYGSVKNGMGAAE